MTMTKLLPLILLLLTLAACRNNAPQQEPQTISFEVYGSVVDPATNSLTLSIRFSGPFTEDRAKKAAEMAIEQNKERFKNITVKTYTTSPLPFLESVFDGNKVVHQINAQVAPQKIPSH